MSLDKLVKSASNIFSQIEEMAKWAAEGVFNRPNAPEFELFKPFDLEVFGKAFDVRNEDQFLNEKPLNSFISKIIDEKIGRLRLYCPEGIRIHLIALPCNSNGKRFKSEQFNHDLDPTTPYLSIVHSDPADDSGLCTGLGSEITLPLLRILPLELNKPCSFIVKYPEYLPNDINKTLQQDRDYLVNEFETIYGHLQNTLKPTTIKK